MTVDLAVRKDAVGGVVFRDKCHPCAGKNRKWSKNQRTVSGIVMVDSFSSFIYTVEGLCGGYVVRDTPLTVSRKMF